MDYSWTILSFPGTWRRESAGKMDQVYTPGRPLSGASHQNFQTPKRSILRDQLPAAG
ncbi:hypothetical protein DESC_810104 [Desulfosarcina cetonica]|nr:hypothetical protein DESC_810104 [Desulfosarcina cetonica]